MNEFSLIERYFSRPCARADVSLSVGDDAAVLVPPPGERLVVSCDTSIGGRHFLADADPRSIGHKVLAVNLSDLAAMGSVPRWVTLALSLPQVDTAWLDEFSEGFYTLAEQASVCLVGGDTTRGDLSITVTAMGTAAPGSILRRDGARPGDLLAVTGTLGDAGMGLAICTGSLEPVDEAVRQHALVRMNRPTPRIEEGILLRDFATAAIDVSD
ncbi:MAG: thiamine-phosphate kinase, partial [Halothiobacillaceae bacterium]